MPDPARQIPLLALIVVAFSTANAQDYFTIEVTDAQTGRGVPLVEVTSPTGQSYVTDSQGIVAFFEPDLMNQSLTFDLTSYGYSPFSQALITSSGGTAKLTIDRLNRAERLYRVTGTGIYRDSVLVNRPVPIDEPLLNADVRGQDSVQTAIYKGQVRWFWGDTLYENGGLGNFRTSGATSLLPSQGGLPPSEGVNLNYFVDAQGRSRQMVPTNDPGPIWLDGVFTVPDSQGQERLFAHFVRVQSFAPYVLYEQGLVEYADATDQFVRIRSYDLEAPITAAGHAFSHEDTNQDYVYFAQSYPNVRVTANATDARDLATWEAFTPLRENTRYDAANPPLELDANGNPVYGWKKNTDPLTTDMLEELTQNGHISRNASPFRLQDVESGNDIRLHRASVHWNDYRNAWIMIGTELFGDSFLGEVWFAEAPTPEGPWKSALKVATHASPEGEYNFYNPTSHPFFDEDGGRVIYFEGTYSNTFTTTDPTPLFDYNQIMYRLDLATIPPLIPQLADFNDDGLFDCTDVDALVAQLASGGTSLLYDLTGDRLVDARDLQRWLADAGALNLGDEAYYIAGDANLDGVVDGQDFLAWNTHKFTETASWCGGDFNADGIVDGQDFVIWNGHKFTSSRDAAVPEPKLAALMGLLMLCVAANTRRTRRGVDVAVGLSLIAPGSIVGSQSDQRLAASANVKSPQGRILGGHDWQG